MSSNTQPPNPLLEIFQKDLRQHVEKLRSAILKQDAKQLQAILKTVRGGAKINKLESLALLCQLALNKMETVLSKGGLVFPDHLPWITAVTAELEALAAIPKEEMPAVCKLKGDAWQSIVPNGFPSSSKEPPREEPKGLALDKSMLELFLNELENQVVILNEGLVEYEQTSETDKLLESLMRAAHSVKGAARVVGVDGVVTLAHSMEDCFVAAQKQRIVLSPERIDVLLSAVDLLQRLSKVPQDLLLKKIEEQHSAITDLVGKLTQHANGGEQPIVEQPVQPAPVKVEPTEAPTAPVDRVLRVTAQNLNRLMGLAGETLIESRWLQPFAESLLRVKKLMYNISSNVDHIRDKADKSVDDILAQHLTELQYKANESRQQLSDCIADLDMFIIRHSSLSDRLYREVIDSRMRPFADGVEGFPRMVRDLSRKLNKKVRLEIVGKSTPVDREILEKLEAPLNHLLRNAVDHGIETPEERVKKGKDPEGVIRLEAQHRAGMLAITVSDDGRGLDIEALRKKIIERNMAKSSIAASMTETELLEFLFLPGFSTAKNVTEISGRGVGLNIVQAMIQDVSGSVRVNTKADAGMTFNLQLPLTLSVLRALLVEIGGEPYAFPLSRIDRSLLMPSHAIELVENRQYFKFQGQNIGIIPATQILNGEEIKIGADELLPIIVLSDNLSTYGVVVDKFMGERELVVQELDQRLGKVPDISSGAMMEDGSPLLVVDVEDLVRSIDSVLSKGSLHKLAYTTEKDRGHRKKRILVVDDSITVREVESRLLQNHGYEVHGAVNGADAWNAIRLGSYDLVVTDVDMPRMNGIELVKLIRSDPRLKDMPILIVSYKEREEDRKLGLEAGANYYLTKSSFHDEALIRAVRDLLGRNEAS